MTTLRGQSNGALDRFQVPAQNTVPIFCKALQVDIHRVYQRQQFPPRFFRNGTVGHQHIAHSGLAHQSCAIPHIFIAHQGLIAGIRDTDIAPAAQAEGLLHQHFRGTIPGTALLSRRCDSGVLAERAA